MQSTRPRAHTRRTRAAWVCAAIAAAIAATTAHPTHASPLELFGFGGRSPALAGAGVASATGYDAVYLNPAGLADAPGKRLTAGTTQSRPTLYLDGSPVDADPATAIVIGGVLPIPLGGGMAGRVTLGLGFHVPTATLNRARHPLPGTPTFVLLDSRAHVVGVQAAVGVALSPRWRVGAGVLALGAIAGAIDITTDAAGRFATSSEQQLLTQMAPIAGVRHLLPERRLTLGLTARAPSRSSYDVTVRNDLGAALPLSVPTLRIAGVAQYDPLTVAAEAAWQATPCLALTAHLAWQRWGAFPPPTENPVASMPPPPPPGFHDVAVPRVAAEWTTHLGATRIAARGGYALALSPAPEMDGPQSLLDNHRHVLGAGLGLAWPRAAVPLHVDVWLQAHLLIDRAHTKDPANFDPGEAPPFDTVRTGGRIAVGGVTVGVDL